jgi:alpha-galactosidase
METQMHRLLVAAALLAASGPVRAADPPRPVQVYVLAGQSNMEGKAKVALMEYQARQPATRDLYRHLLRDDRWLVRDDVWVKFLERKGKLTVGFGSPGCIGPELGFGTVIGDRQGGQVLLIKAAWGGKSLYRDFRPPAAGLPPQAVLDQMLAELRQRQPDARPEDVQKTFGASYRAMLAEVNDTLSNLKGHFPDYAGQGWELAGFVWFQGWNDMIRPEYTAAYTENLAHFIRDVRKDLKAPALPFVVGQMGVGGEEPDANVRKFKAAQAAVMELREFQGNVALVKTDVYWDREADAVYRKGWRQHLEEWNQVGSDYPYHYLGSPKTFLKIGQAFAEAVLDLRGQK